MFKSDICTLNYSRRPKKITIKINLTAYKEMSVCVYVFNIDNQLQQKLVSNEIKQNVISNIAYL